MRYFYLEQFVNEQKDKTCALDKSLPSVYALVKETARRFSLGNIEVKATSNDLYLAEKYDFVEILGETAVYKNHWDVMGVPYNWNMVHYDEQLLGGILLHYGYATEMATGEGKTLVATLPVFLNALSHDGVHVITVNDYLSKRDFETTRPLYMFYGLSADCIEYYNCYDRRRRKHTNLIFLSECIRHLHLIISMTILLLNLKNVFSKTIIMLLLTNLTPF